MLFSVRRRWRRSLGSSLHGKPSAINAVAYTRTAVAHRAPHAVIEMAMAMSYNLVITYNWLLTYGINYMLFLWSYKML